MLIVLSVLWIVYALAIGITEAMHYHYNIYNPNRKFNEHIIYSINRVFVLSSFAALDWRVSAFSILTFMFFHDGAYYQTRNRLNPNIYKKGWNDMSTTSNAISDRFATPLVRFSLALLGFMYLIAVIYLT